MASMEGAGKGKEVLTAVHDPEDIELTSDEIGSGRANAQHGGLSWVPIQVGSSLSLQPPAPQRVASTPSLGVPRFNSGIGGEFIPPAGRLDPSLSAASSGPGSPLTPTRGDSGLIKLGELGEEAPAHPGVSEGPGRFGSIKFLSEGVDEGQNRSEVRAGGLRVSIDIEDDDEDEDVLGNLFDLTPYRLQLIFNIIQEKDPASPVDSTMAIPYQQFSEGLKRFGLGIDGEAFETLVTEVDADGSGDITFEEFEVAVQRLKLEYLFREATVDRYEAQREAAGLASARLICLDFSPASYEPRVISGEQAMWRWACSSRPKWARMRWVSVEGQGDELLLQRLAVKYRLHPLSVEDALEDTGAKVDKFENGYIFICLPTLEVFEEIAEDSVSSVGSHEAPKFKRVSRTSFDRRHKDGVRMSTRRTKPSPSLRKMPSLSSPIQREVAQPRSRRRSGGLGRAEEGPQTYRVMTSQISMFLMYPKYDTFMTVAGDGHTSHLVRAVREKIETNDMLRQYDASYLLYRVMDAVVDNLVMAGKFFRRMLRTCRDDLRTDGPFFRIRRVDDLTRELNKVIRYARPLARVVKHCIVDDDISANCTLYLTDVEDHLSQLMDELSELLNECGELQADFKYKRDERTARLMYLFTVVATIFLPAQFITGVFGMNFQHMPELEWRQGYRMFWAGLALYFGVAAAVLWNLKPGFDQHGYR